MPTQSPSGTRCTCTTRSLFKNVHLVMSILEPMPLAQSATANSRSSGVIVSPLTRLGSRLDPGLARPVVERLGQPAPVQAVHVVAIEILGEIAAARLAQRSRQRRGGVHQVGGVELLQPPPAGPRGRSRLTVGAQGQRLGADQLDLLAGALDFRANPHVAVGRHRSQQIDGNPTQPGVVAGGAAFQRANQKRRHRCGVLNRRRPGAAD